AIQRERMANGGKRVYVAALTENEWVLDIPEAAQYAKLREKYGDDPLQRIALPLADGGDEFIRQQFTQRIPSTPRSMMIASGGNSSPTVTNTFNATMTVVTPNADSFRRSQSQIERKQAQQLLANLRRG
ncbi:MAG: hypothetical protein VKJ24_15445, partial [Synechococcales bacterium]|nr:hypothetical protein [Synechococcales bacterium]